MDSMESRWVYQDEEGSEIDNDGGLESPQKDSDDEDNAEQRLIRTGPRIDSFDVEALEVPGAHRNDFEESRVNAVNNYPISYEIRALLVGGFPFDQWWNRIVSKKKRCGRKEVLENDGLNICNESQDATLGRRIGLAFQTLGVVFGDVGTSPLYTFSVMFSKAPVNGDEDVIGALSLVLYTLILTSLVKYVLIVLWANDDGEGGTFALYSLICRHAKVSLLPNQLPSDARISSFRLKVPSAELERSLKIKERLESSHTLKKLLLMLVLAGTSMVILDGVVTPAMSVISAVGGLDVGISGFEQAHQPEKDRNVASFSFVDIELRDTAYNVQRYGTSKVGIVVGPALFIWFCSLGGIGIYNLVKYDSSEAMFADLCYFSVRSVQLTFVFLVLPCLLLGYLGQAAYLMENHADTTQAFFSSVPSGAYWAVFLIANVAALIASRAMTTATFSCIKQSTALGCFPRLKIIHTSRKFMGQIYIPVMNWFLLALTLVLVCNISSIYEIGNAYGISDLEFKQSSEIKLHRPRFDWSLFAGIAELGVMMMTTILVTLVMLLIWQINIFIVLSFVIIFLGLELTFLSSVLWSVGDGSWIILVFAIVIFLIMYIWNYGSKLKYETEVKQKMSMDVLRELGPDLGTVRAPGIGLIYNELAKGVPAIFGHFLTTLPAVHSMIIFVCIKYVPVSVVPQSERFLFRRVCPKSYHIFRCVARYGYKDVRKENHQTFEQLLIESLEKFIRREAQERSLESDDDDSDAEGENFSRILIAPNGSVYSLAVPLLEEFKDASNFIPEGSTVKEQQQAQTDEITLDAEQSLEKELSFLRKAKESGVVYLLGHGDIRARKDSWFIKKLVINYFYAFLRKNSRRGTANLSVPHSHLIQVGMTYMV
ncbi:hypothetical protein SASPL_132188 [Salvia splendens]|uniref:KUP system potassium uptake protein n=1 Tax=Salvia splendens TaxID=180675 RepID=A0A8X8X925_SALSN|nr:hypothetical protein SASPL_132184 [Salvia splendens]KAG6409154.1 hypothetical protein SASPL_132188 [Salvia splendens]